MDGGASVTASVGGAVRHLLSRRAGSHHSHHSGTPHYHHRHHDPSAGVSDGCGGPGGMLSTIFLSMVRRPTLPQPPPPSPPPPIATGPLPSSPPPPNLALTLTLALILTLTRPVFHQEALLFGAFTCCMMLDQSTVVTTNLTQIDRLKGKVGAGFKHHHQSPPPPPPPLTPSTPPLSPPSSPPHRPHISPPRRSHHTH